MDQGLLKILSEELRETKNLVLETRRMADELQLVTLETRKVAINPERKADAAERKADAACEFVIMTRNKIEEELRDLRMPWWKKLFGTAA